MSGVSKSPRAPSPPADSGEPERDRQSVSDQLVRKLLSDPEFLTVPESEASTARKLGCDKWSLREAVMGFIRDALLVRSERGIVRDVLPPGRLSELFGIRYAFERAAITIILAHPDRANIARDLVWTLKSHDLSHKTPTENGDVDTQIDWILSAIDFHETMVKMAGLSDMARIVRSLILQIRIGSCTAIETPDERKIATDEHIKLIQRIRRGGEWDAILDEFIQNHYRRSWSKALKRFGRDRPDISVDEPDDWKKVVTLLDDPRNGSREFSRERNDPMAAQCSSSL